MIVFYHLLLIYIVPFNNNILYKALELPAHIGVVLFVLLSGYFGIKPSSKGFLKLIFVFFIYSVPEIYFNMDKANNYKEIIKSLLFFSHTHFWFIRTYVFLYLLSPIINLYLKRATIQQRWFILFVLFFISNYIGTVGGDSTLSDGKNAINFMFLYTVGNTLFYYKDVLKKIRLKMLLSTYLFINLILIVGYLLLSEHLLGKVIWRLSFPYSSPLLLCNSIVFFLIFSKIEIQNNVINWLAKSSLAIYLIHGNRPLFMDWNGFVVNTQGGVIGYLLQKIRLYAINDFTLCVLLLITTAFIILIAIGIDKILTPLWNSSNKLFNKAYQSIGF